MANPIIKQINAELDTLQKELTQFKSTVAYLNGAKNNVQNAVLTVNEAKAFYGQKIDEVKATYESLISLSEAIDRTVAKIETINFPERLDSIERAVNKTITSLNETRTETIDELQRASEVITNSDFEGKFKRLQQVVDDSTKANKTLGESIEKQKIPEKIDAFEKSLKSKIEVSYADLQKNIKPILEQQIKYINDLNLPKRLDKVDGTLAGLLTTISKFQTRLEVLEKNIIGKLNDESERQLGRIETLKNKINQELLLFKEQILASQKKQRINTYITWAIVVVSVSFAILIFKTS